MSLLRTPLPDNYDEEAEKAEIEKLKNSGPDFIEKYGLEKWTSWVPLSLAFFGALTASGVYHVDAETQIVLCTVLFGAVVTDTTGGSVGQAVTEQQRLDWLEKTASDRVIEEKLSQLGELYDKTLGISSDFKELSNGVVSLLKQQDTNAKRRHMHQVYEAAKTALDQQVASERRATAMKRREIISTGMNAVRQYLADPALRKRGDDVAVLRMATNDMKVNLNLMPKNSDDAVDPVYVAFHSYLTHRLEHAQKNSTAETKVIDEPLLAALLKTTEEAIAVSLPKGVTANVPTLPAIDVKDPVDTTSAALAAVQAVNEKVFSAKQTTQEEFNMDKVDWKDPFAGVTARKGPKPALEAFLAEDASADDSAPKAKASKSKGKGKKKA